EYYGLQPLSSEPEQPVYCGQRWSTVANQRSATIGHRRTTVAPPPNHHQSTMVDCWLMVGSGSGLDSGWVATCHHLSGATWHE
nr:hypothetical protein [Tanacetum cinerariifolium]